MTPQELIRLPPREAIRWMRERGIVPPDIYSALPGEYRQLSFSVAGVAALDQLQAVLDSLTEAAASGETFSTWRRRVEADEIALTLPRHRLDNIFRTNMQGAYMRGVYERQHEVQAQRPYLMYDAINDSRTRPTHRAMDNHIAPADDAIWSTHRPPLGYRCFLPGTPIRADARVGLRSHYRGEAVEVVTADGHRLSATANHPVLAPHGWVEIKTLREGGEVLCDPSSGEWLAVPGVVDNDNPPARAEDLFDALAAQALGCVPMSAFDFHGDASLRQGDVDVAGADGVLMHGYQAAGAQRVKQRQFPGADRVPAPASLLPDSRSEVGAVAANAVLSQQTIDVAGRAPKLLSKAALADAQFCAVSGQNDALDLIIRGARDAPCGAELTLDGGRVALDFCPLESLGLRSGAMTAVDPEPAGQRWAARSDTRGERLDGFSGVERGENGGGVGRVPAGQVALVHSVRAFWYEGPVYDFETRTGAMFAGGIIAHNCRCTLTSLTEQQARDRGYQGLPAPNVQPDDGWAYDKAAGIGEGVRQSVQRALQKSHPRLAAAVPADIAR
jgi:SPP1 gp7 family putative phage head morphogenesis protein